MFLKISSSIGFRTIRALKSTTEFSSGNSPFRARKLQIYIDNGNYNAQYLVVMAVLLLKVAQHSGIKGPVRLENLAREKRQRRETLHGNQEEGCEEKEETLTRERTRRP